LRDAVLEYLTQRPRSMDTLGGIASWWIMDPSPVDRQELNRALEELVELGVLEQVPTARQTFYRLRNPPGGNGGP